MRLAPIFHPWFIEAALWLMLVTGLLEIIKLILKAVLWFIR